MPKDDKLIKQQSELNKELVLKSLRGYFKEKNIKYIDVAQSLGVTPEYVSVILKGRKGIGAKSARKLCDVYGFSLTWILTGEGYMFNDESEGLYTTDIQKLKNIIKEKNKEIQELRIKYENLRDTILNACNEIGSTKTI